MDALLHRASCGRLKCISVLRRKQCIAYPIFQGRQLSSLAYLEQEMTTRKLPIICDNSNSTPANLLNVTLSDFLPKAARYEAGIDTTLMAPSHHLVYLPPATPLSSLLPDGTDPLHSPGPPFTRRMWAGGDMTFHEPFHFTNQPMSCHESITKVDIKGVEGLEKIFVTIKRDIRHNGDHTSSDSNGLIVENRRLVFMRDKPRQQDTALPAAAARNIVKYQHQAEYSHTLKPTAALLFRFSALTFNAHAIHLDKNYCKDIEGHRNLLVHGPLGVILMMQIVQGFMRLKSANRIIPTKEITYLEYRNIAPLYAEEEMKICVRQKEKHIWETWIEGPDGGLAVRGTVRTADSRVAMRPEVSN
ncbi:MAG: hypothetical protein Q9220_004968 [cf. Caloplaca sp. 1 TL-2023]